jgi:hypothetical protein
MIIAIEKLFCIKTPEARHKFWDYIRIIDECSDPLSSGEGWGEAK